jgi:LysM repeat protein
MKRLLKYNDMNYKTKVQPGDRIFLQLKHRNGDLAYHTVKEDETMFEISQMHGIQLMYLYEKNKMIMGTEPEAGEILNLRSDRISPPKLRTKQKVVQKELTSYHTDSLSENIYVVKKGDTLYAISKMYNLTVEELKQLNNLHSNALSVGDKLKVK